MCIPGMLEKGSHVVFVVERTNDEKDRGTLQRMMWTIAFLDEYFSQVYL